MTVDSDLPDGGCSLPPLGISESFIIGRDCASPTAQADRIDYLSPAEDRVGWHSGHRMPDDQTSFSANWISRASVLVLSSVPTVLTGAPVASKTSTSALAVWFGWKLG